MADIKDLTKAADKWQRRASIAQQDYQDGVKNPRRSWSAAAIAANSAYVQAVTQAAQQGRYLSGVKQAGDEKWAQNATAKGPNRFAEGVTLAVGEWQRGFQPYAEAIKNLKLPERGPTGSPQNLQRVQTVALALRELRTKLKQK
jgi:hypothetical protein